MGAYKYRHRPVYKIDMHELARQQASVSNPAKTAENQDWEN